MTVSTSTPKRSISTAIPPPFYTRQNLKHAQTVVVKIGTEIVNEVDGYLSLGRIGSIVEQICRLHTQGKRVILVSSGSVGIGRLVMRRQFMLSGSMQSHIGGNLANNAPVDPKACAAAGQSSIQSLYDTLFSHYAVACSQILATDADFRVPKSREHLRNTINALIGIGIIPIINENDVVSQRTVPLTDDNSKIAWDNDSLAALVACEVGADVLLIISDMPGLYKELEDGSKTLISEYEAGDKIALVEDSRIGRIGQEDKLNSALMAVSSGDVKAVVIADTTVHWSIMKIMQGEDYGTFFCARKHQVVGSPSNFISDPRYENVDYSSDSQKRARKKHKHH